MEKMRMESIDMTAQNIDKIAALFPNCITETVGENGDLKKVINFDLLRQMLSGDVIEGDEAYELPGLVKRRQSSRLISLSERHCVRVRKKV